MLCDELLTNWHHTRKLARVTGSGSLQVCTNYNIYRIIRNARNARITTGGLAMVWQSGDSFHARLTAISNDVSVKLVNTATDRLVHSTAIHVNATRHFYRSNMHAVKGPNS